MTATSAVNPLRTGVHAALTAAGIRMYLGLAPRSAALPYVILDAETETEEGARFMQAGHDQAAQVRCWADDAWLAQELYERVKNALHGVSLSVAGYRLEQSQVDRVTGFLDQGLPEDATGPYCVVGRLRTRTMVAL